MKAKDVAEVFEQIAPVSIGLPGDREGRVLGFRFGDPNVEVTGVGVAWLPSIEVIRQAVGEGLNFIIAHEPGVFIHNPPSPWHSALLPDINPANLKRKKLLLDHNICVYTAHSNWDLQPEVGMQPTIAKSFGLTDEVTRDVSVGIYSVPEMTFGDLIARVKQATRLGLLRVWGDRKRPVRKVGLGFGGMVNVVDSLIIHGADAGILGVVNEFEFIHARENDVPIIEATHLVTESIGFRSVVTELQDRLPALRIRFLEVPFSYEFA